MPLALDLFSAPFYLGNVRVCERLTEIPLRKIASHFQSGILDGVGRDSHVLLSVPIPSVERRVRFEFQTLNQLHAEIKPVTCVQICSFG